MKRLVLLVMVAAVALIAADVKGTWKGQINRPDRTKEEDVVLQFSGEGDSITGKIGTNEHDMIPVRNTALKGNRLTFEVSAHEAIFTITLDFDGDSAKGGVIRTVNGKSEPFCPIELKRAK
jgi:hypothetical protein